MICGDAVYAPCPPPHGTHTAVPPVHDGTAFTGPDLFGASVILGFLLLMAALSFALRYLFTGEGEL